MLQYSCEFYTYKYIQIILKNTFTTYFLVLSIRISFNYIPYCCYNVLCDVNETYIVLIYLICSRITEKYAMC